MGGPSTHPYGAAAERCQDAYSGVSDNATWHKAHPMPMGSTIALLWLLAACAEPGNKDAHLPGPDATPETQATVAWAASVDADTSTKPLRCESPQAASDGAVVTIRRTRDSATNIVVVFRGPGGLAEEHYYARADRVLLFVRVDESFGDATTGRPPKRNVDSTWYADGRVTRWIDSLGASRSLGRRSVGARAANIQRFYERWLNTCPGGP